MLYVISYTKLKCKQLMYYIYNTSYISIFIICGCRLWIDITAISNKHFFKHI